MDNKISNEEVINDIVKDLNLNDNSVSSTITQKNDDLKDTEETAKSEVCTKNITTENLTSNDSIPKDFELDDETTNVEDTDDETLRNIEESLSEADKEKNRQQALELKNKGNEEFKCGNYIDSINLYTKAINTCPFSYKTDRSVFYCNRAAAKIKLNHNEGAIEDCTKAIEFNSNYLKAYIRRAKLYETTEKLDESLKDFTKILELDPSNSEARAALVRLPPMINERNEKLKAEMLGKLKDLGNMVLRPFGLSTDNFKLQQDPETGGYSVNFQQNHRN